MNVRCRLISGDIASEVLYCRQRFHAETRPSSIWLKAKRTCRDSRVVRFLAVPDFPGSVSLKDKDVNLHAALSGKHTVSLGLKCLWPATLCCCKGGDRVKDKDAASFSLRYLCPTRIAWQIHHTRSHPREYIICTVHHDEASHVFSLVSSVESSQGLSACMRSVFGRNEASL